MIDVYARVEDYICIYGVDAYLEKLKGILCEGVSELLNNYGVEYSWVSDNYIMLDEVNEDIEEKAKEYLDSLYSEFIDTLNSTE